MDAYVLWNCLSRLNCLKSSPSDSGALQFCSLLLTERGTLGSAVLDVVDDGSGGTAASQNRFCLSL